MNPSKKLIGMMALCVFLMTGCLAKEADNTIPAESGSAATTASTDAKAAARGYAEEIDKTKIMSLSIDADEAEWQKMLDSASEEQYISANVTINGTTITNVGIRPKGNSSLKQIVNDDTSDRFSFKIKFDEYVKDQTWEGLDTLVVNNMISDNSYMKEYVSYDIMSEIGVDTPLFAFANIKVNGNAWAFIWRLKP